jgi:hypothetical protein
MPGMDPHDHREKLRQLADDLDWLEGHCRRQPDLAPHAGQLRLAAALGRNVLGGRLEGQPPSPLHVAVVGGAGAGKSTVVNFLCGTVVADANPQAGYTRHPTAYLPAALPGGWPAYLGFLGPLRRLSEAVPANLDEDVYQVRRVPPFGTGPDADPLAEFVVWDCPDMTTWASAGYVSRLMEVSALADVVVYVASDERYNDEVPTEFLHLLVRAGKAVVVVLTKMRPADAPALAEHFRTEVLARVTSGGEIPPVPCVAVPNLTPAERADPPTAAAKYRVQLVNQLLVLCPTPAAARDRTVRNAVRYLETAGEGLLDVARGDLAELETWAAAVEAGRTTFEERYRREFLAGEPFRRFDRTREQLLAMLEPAGPVRYLGAAVALLRVPYTYARDFIAKAAGRPDPPALPERTVLASAFTGWLDSLQAEALRRAGTHPVWKQLAHAFDAGLKQEATDRFDAAARQFELTESSELEQAGRSLTDYLSSRPGVLGGLRVAKLLADVAAVALVVVFTWPPSWYLLLFVPLAVAVTHQVAELAVRGAVEAARTSARAKRETLLRDQLTGPMAKWLDERPAAGGSSVERLQLALRRVPAVIRELAAAVRPPEPPPPAAAP